MLLSFPVQFATGFVLLLAVTLVPLWGVYFWQKMDINSINSLYGITICFTLTSIVLQRLIQYPGTTQVAYVLPVTSLIYGLLLFFYLVSRIDYSNQIVIKSYAVTLSWCYAEYFLSNRFRVIRFAVVPFGTAKQLPEAHGAIFIPIGKRPELPDTMIHAITADLGSASLTPEWERFLARCTLNGIPVYHVKQVREAITGRVRIDHLSENAFGSLQPSTAYSFIKRIADVLGAVLLIVLTLPIVATIALLIRLESPGPVIFKQRRLGFRGKPFTMLKLRSMRTNIDGEKFTSGIDDPRITNVGRVIRKFRIDELPQLLNIVKGDMSFIGPRPEALELSAWYEKDVPFFAYRHIVRPGISGWAQVELGYAAEIDGMKIKLEYDFYYIKNFSFWLDILITFKTVKTILTGFGAR